MYNMNPYGSYRTQNINNYQNPYLPPNQVSQPAMNTNTQMPQNSSIIPVASIDEVRAYPVDFTGAPMYFDDKVNGKIYVKYLGLNGAPITDIYSKDTQGATQSEYITRNEFDKLKENVTNFINSLGGMSDVQSNDANANA